MPVIVMKAISACNHPNADALRVYDFEAPGYERKQIVANLENVYEVGDFVYVALEGSVLLDGAKIKVTKIRGLISSGMALGKAIQSDEVPNLQLGNDLTHLFCKPAADVSGISIITWPDIESLHNIKRDLDKANQAPKVRYRAKVKLDGTNAGVQLTTDGKIAAQSRSNVITSEHDNLGFAAWVEQNSYYFNR